MSDSQPTSEPSKPVISRRKKKELEEEEQGPPSGTTKKGGWGNDNSKQETKPAIQDYEKATLERQDKPDEEVIPVIPNLDDVAEEDLGMQVADAPKQNQLRVQTIKELEGETNYALPSISETRGIDMSFMTKLLPPPSQILEPDVQWNFARLFVEVSSEIQAEITKKTELDDIAAGNGVAVAKNEAALALPVSEK